MHQYGSNLHPARQCKLTCVIGRSNVRRFAGWRFIAMRGIEMKSRLSAIVSAFIVTIFVASSPSAQNIRGSAEGPTKAAGYDHPDQFMHLKEVQPVDNMYPVIAHPEQEKQARDK